MITLYRYATFATLPRFRFRRHMPDALLMPPYAIAAAALLESATVTVAHGSNSNVVAVAAASYVCLRRFDAALIAAIRRARAIFFRRFR